MPLLYTGRTTLYYDIFSANVTEPSLPTTSPAMPPLLLIHGFGGTPQNDFAAQLPLLATQYTVLAPHLHGYGLSSHRTSYSATYYREDVADLIALLDALRIASVAVLGFSDGAIVGLLLAALHPQRVSALAILGAQATVNEDDVAAIRCWLLEKPLSDEWQQELARLHGEPYWRTLPAIYVEGQEKLVASGGVLISDAELAAIRCPTLIMHGKRDRVVSVEYAYILHNKIPGSQLLLFDAGHAAHLRCEKAYTAAIVQFFQDSQKARIGTI